MVSFDFERDSDLPQRRYHVDLSRGAIGIGSRKRAVDLQRLSVRRKRTLGVELGWLRVTQLVQSFRDVVSPGCVARIRCGESAQDAETFAIGRNGTRPIVRSLSTQADVRETGREIASGERVVGIVGGLCAGNVLCLAETW